MTRTLSLLAFLVLLASACTPSLPFSDARTIVADGNQLLLHNPDGRIDKARWPQTIAALDPEHVYAAPEGLYICTRELFVDQQGFFVPRSGTAIPHSPTGDPSYTPLRGGLFTYHIRG
ncbi:hypothetical protein [Luteimonas mephitis]|uniref:hypothetical protein n=1 Tax=Luteimonas mephitis TaxID=83615 RepID=UPI0012EB4C40|nr:hypothetical protein [Luteimonas mephitis]